MQVALATGFGPPEVLVTREVAHPGPGPGEVVIDVTAADSSGRTPAGSARARHRSSSTNARRTSPATPWPVTWVRSVAASTPPGLGRPWWRTRVVSGEGMPSGWRRLSATCLRCRRGSGSSTSSCLLLHDGPTAPAPFQGLRVTAGDTLLVVGASGGLGIVSRQLARAYGARAVAVARDAGKLARIREMDVGAVVDSDHPGSLDQARTALGGAGADVILDNVGGRVGEAAFGLVAPGGRFSAHGTPSGRFAAVDPAEAQRLGVTVHGIKDVQLTRENRRRLTSQALAEAAAGRLRPVVGKMFPLTRAAQAHAAIAGRAVFGKTLLAYRRRVVIVTFVPSERKVAIVDAQWACGYCQLWLGGGARSSTGRQDRTYAICAFFSDGASSGTTTSHTPRRERMKEVCGRARGRSGARRLDPVGGGSCQRRAHHPLRGRGRRGHGARRPRRPPQRLLLA